MSRPIGRGAYGEVWLARNVMGAPRAVKVVWRSQFDSERPYEREFAGIQSYEPVSRSADGLVHVLHVGRNDAQGYFYYVMELADAADPAEGVGAEPAQPTPPSGQPSDAMEPGALTPLHAYLPRTLRSDLDRHPRIPTAACLRLALDVVSGLGHLHRRGLVHRDVKPGNVIFVGGRAKLADIGLVATGGEPRTFVGTEGYIPPEGPGTPAADLYALGVTLYEASTGLPASRFPDVPAEWLHDDESADALELHDVILKAGEAQRERRYQSAEEMQADLALLQSGRSVRRVRTLERRAKLAWRASWAAGLLLLAAVSIALVANWRARVEAEGRARETRLREHAQQSQQRAEAAEVDSRQKLYHARLAEAKATVLSVEVGRRSRAMEAVRQAAAIRNTPELRREAFAALALPDLQLRREIDVGPYRSLSLDPAFTRYAITRGRGPVELFSLSNDQRVATLPAATNLTAQLPTFSKDGRYLAFKRDRASGSDSDLEVWDLTSTQRVLFVSHAVGHEAISFHPRAARLLAGAPTGRAVAWDLERGREWASWPLPPLRHVSYSPDGTRFAVAYEKGRSGVVETRDAASGAVLISVSFPKAVYSVSWHPDGLQLAVPCSDGSVNVMNAMEGNVRTVGWHKAQAVRSSFVAGGNYLCSSGWDGEANLWNLRTLQRELTIAAGSHWIQFAEAGPQAALITANHRLQLLEFASASEGRELTGALQFTARSGAFSPDHRWLAVPALDGLALWDLTQPDQAKLLTQAGIGPVSFGPAEDELFAASDRRLYRWRLSPALESNAPPRLEPLSAFVPRGHLDAAYLLKKLAATLIADADGLRLVPQLNLGININVAAPIQIPVSITALAPDEQRLALAAARSPVIRILRLPELTTECHLTNSAPVRSLAFSPDGRTLAVMTDRSLLTWDTARWKATQARPVQTDAYARIVYEPAGRMLLAIENTRHGGLLDARTLEFLLPLPAWNHPVALSADGRRLAVSVENRRVVLWDLPGVRARFRELGIDWSENSREQVFEH